MAFSEKPLVPKGLQPWPSAARTGPLSVSQVEDMYVRGFRGTVYSEDERAALLSEMPQADGEQVCYDAGIVESGKGKLSLPYKYAQDRWNCWPKPPQKTGNCVGKCGANIGTICIGVDVASEQPDEITGRLEGFPELSALGIAQGVVAEEPIYGDRGHAGEGANCERLIRHVTEWGGIILRKNYADIGLNLEKCDTALSIKWGRSQTPENVRALGRTHQIRRSTVSPTWETGRDFVSQGCPLWVCSGLGFSNKRDENGFSKQSGSWAHSWAIGGFDDRPWTYQKYGHPLALFIHDWDLWNSGGDQIKDTPFSIPPGTMWIDARLLNKCDVFAMTSIDGWANPHLPDLLGGW